jgi:hypothetical protein
VQHRMMLTRFFDEAPAFNPNASLITGDVRPLLGAARRRDDLRAHKKQDGDDRRNQQRPPE